MFESIDAAGWMTIGGCLLLGFCVVYFVMDKPRKGAPVGGGNTETNGPDSAAAQEKSARHGAGDGGSAQQESTRASGWSGSAGRKGHRNGFGAADENPQHWSEVLDVPAVAPADEIKAAYRRKMSQYHPDKVAALGPELKDLADLMTKRINRAFEQAMRDRA